MGCPVCSAVLSRRSLRPPWIHNGYSFQNINGQYVNTGKRKRRAVEIEGDAQDNEDYLKNSKKEKEGYSVEIKVKPEDAL